MTKWKTKKGKNEKRKNNSMYFPLLTSSNNCAAISNRVESRLLSRKDALYRPMSRPISGVNSCSVMACKYVIVLNHITYVCVFLQSKHTFSNSSTPNCNIVEKSLTYSDDEKPLPHDLQYTEDGERKFFDLGQNVLAEICGRFNRIFDGLNGKISGFAKWHSRACLMWRIHSSLSFLFGVER